MHTPQLYGCFILLALTACTTPTKKEGEAILANIQAAQDSSRLDTVIEVKGNVLHPTEELANMSEVQEQDAITDFAETLIGVPYKYGSSDPAVGFDCSGFISYVFNHFNITVPRSSADFTRTGVDIPVNSSIRGDVILFTGTDSTEAGIGHVGIITNNTNGAVNFIHATSGKQMSVTITPLNDYYKSRFVKVIRVTKA
jgi:cell wall-associated NlpC family hydrolase